METPKSHVADILPIVLSTLTDLYALLSGFIPMKEKDIQKDAQYLTSRFTQEGLGFFTVVLPRMGEYLDQIIQGKSATVPYGFSTHMDRPNFLKPLWSYLQTSLLREDEESARATAYIVRVARTLLYGFKKLELPFQPSQEAEMLAKFLQIEEEMEEFIPLSTTYIVKDLLNRVLADFDWKPLRPKHGPGAVANGEKGAQKWEFNSYFRSTHAQYPFYDHFWALLSSGIETNGVQRRLELASHAADYRKIIWHDYPTARLLMVPKDSRGPRIIACEPKELMYLQQGVTIRLMDLIEAHPLTSGHVNFADQSINGNLALIGSKSREWATIDLSDASDRVSMSLVRAIFPDSAIDSLEALRSKAVLLPDGKILQLKKHALMGSALCFPVESLVFWSIAMTTLIRKGLSISEARELVYVYGDDIIIPDAYATFVMSDLERYGLKVNRSKSLCGNHGFRESCGVDALNGFIITPLRIRKLPPRSSRDANAIVAYVDYASNDITPCRNLAIEAIVSRVFGELPYSSKPQAFLCYINGYDHRLYDGSRWNSATCTVQRKGYVPQSKGNISKLDSYTGVGHALRWARGHANSRVVDTPSTLIATKWVTIR